MIYKIESIVFHIKAKIYVQKKNDTITFQTCFHFFQISDLRFEISDCRFEFQISDFRFQISDCSWGGGTAGRELGEPGRAAASKGL